MKKQITLSLMAFAVAGTAPAQSQMLSDSTPVMGGQAAVRQTSPTAVPEPAAVAGGGYAGERLIAWFVEPSLFYVPANNGLDDSFGGMLSGGVILQGRHKLGLDFAYFEADYDRGPGKMEFMPLTASYQYVLPLSNGFQVRPGVFAGAMFEKSDGRPGVSDSSRTAFTGGLSLGVDYAINETVSVGVSGKWMYVDEVKDLRERNMALIGINCSVKF